MPPKLIRLTFVLGLLLALPVFGQVPAPNKPADAQPAILDPYGRDTPKGTVVGFIKAASEKDIERAALFIDARKLPKPLDDRILELLVVLNYGVLTRDLERLSSKPEGSLDDDLAPNMERVGVVQRGTRTLDILLERIERPGQPAFWRFSEATLAGVPAIHEQVRLSRFEELIWPPLKEIRFLEVPLWQWLGFPLALLVVVLFARLLSRGLFTALRPLMFRLAGEGTRDALAQIEGPVRVAALSIAVFAWLTVASLPLLARFTLGRAALVLGVIALAWLLIRLIDIAMQIVEARLGRLHRPREITIAQLAAKIGKAVIIILGALTLLYLVGVDLTAALAGLGIGGVAIAFAAQKTLENLFGGVMIISDQPVRVGDFCKVGDLVGTVESIGLRSTRIRTLDRTVVSIPNARMATENLENFGFRDKSWFRPTLGLRYDTAADQLRYVLAEIRRMFYEHQMVETESARIRFVSLGATSLDLEIFAYVLTGDRASFLEVQEDLLLRIMDIVDASGTGFAFPTSTTYIARDPGLNSEKTEEAIAQVRRWREEHELPFPNFHPSKVSEFQDRLEYPPPESAVAKPG
jgi:MscS family membrane protein